jgi:hypothetical protein
MDSFIHTLRNSVHSSHYKWVESKLGLYEPEWFFKHAQCTFGIYYNTHIEYILKNDVEGNSFKRIFDSMKVYYNDYNYFDVFLFTIYNLNKYGKEKQQKEYIKGITNTGDWDDLLYIACITVLDTPEPEFNMFMKKYRETHGTIYRIVKKESVIFKTFIKQLYLLNESQLYKVCLWGGYKSWQKYGVFIPENMHYIVKYYNLIFTHIIKVQRDNSTRTICIDTISGKLYKLWSDIFYNSMYRLHYTQYQREYIFNCTEYGRSLIPFLETEHPIRDCIYNTFFSNIRNEKIVDSIGTCGHINMNILKYIEQKRGRSVMLEIICKYALPIIIYANETTIIEDVIKIFPKTTMFSIETSTPFRCFILSKHIFSCMEWLYTNYKPEIQTGFLELFIHSDSFHFLTIVSCIEQEVANFLAQVYLDCQLPIRYAMKELDTPVSSHFIKALSYKVALDDLLEEILMNPNTSPVQETRYIKIKLIKLYLERAQHEMYIETDEDEEYKENIIKRIREVVDQTEYTPIELFPIILNMRRRNINTLEDNNWFSAICTWKYTEEKQCLVSYDDISYGSLYVECKSNVPHVCLFNTYMYLNTKICPYCRADFKSCIYVQQRIIKLRTLD